MIKLAKRSTKKACSPKELSRHVKYLENTEHKRHLEKIVLCARNYNCPGNSAREFIDEVMRLDARYRKFRTGKPGRPGRRLFEEIIYNSPKGVQLSDQERGDVEKTVLDLIGNGTAFRVGWHIDKKTGRSDMHVLMASRNQAQTPAPTLWSRFQKSNHIFVEFDLCDQLINQTLGKTRGIHIPTARQIRQSKYAPVPLARELARIADGPVSMENLSSLITQAGHKVLSITERTICLILRGWERKLRYNFRKLIADINEEIHVLELQQMLEKSLSPDSRPHSGKRHRN